MAALVVGLGGWSSTTKVEGAIIANGAVVSESGSRKVQHPEGGIVRQILVQNNQQVEAGQLLLTLDDVSLRAELEVVLSQLREGLGAKARLTAESTGASAIDLPEVAGHWPPDPRLSAVLGEQQSLRLSRAKSLESEIARLNELIGEKQSVIEGYRAQLEAYTRQMNLVRDEVAQQTDLFSKELVSNQRLNEMKRNEAELSGQVLSVQASIAATEASISELRMQADQIVTDFQAEALAELQTVSQTVAELMQKMIAARARLSRLEVRAPIAGTVHESIVQTVGGVVSPGDTLMLVVPQETHLKVDMRVSPLEVSKLHVGQAAEVRMLNFDAQTTPNLEGRVDSISPDLVRDSATGVQYYSVRVDIADTERDKLPGGAALVPGMPAESFFQTGERTVWSYLMAPIQDRLSHTFRE
ncbi:MAG: HlyD family type I secretion periplasmic adaptor subunit [Alphaproteobacteria bacterium]|nr:HlyD family type I secretion periplasmic adaptor subunit [Alphaproteobacteria bacterium]MBU1561610.1 HlyD family type I secretion periplasmic adaptor subunit [Alphaproteobacteria bacterium]MBU2302409.1 HlyD family type I secretion periplasmic adaptor subunit [Alphaproteobacteria bacterium]MBU2368689.1 HlyD family type I secretion periplasmic adaptor subunit [Alphaproteobacteria bacterium]